jgi:hypothetical protein
MKHVASTASIGSACYLFHEGVLLGLFFGPEDGGDIFFGSIS